MKKSPLIALFSLILAACSSGVTDVESVPRTANIKHLCLKGSAFAAPENYVASLTDALKRKGISSEMYSEQAQNCTHLLAFRAKGNAKVVASSVLRVIQVNPRKQLGEVEYRRRGEERARSNQVGVQGQVDTMINELFKQY